MHSFTSTYFAGISGTSSLTSDVLNQVGCGEDTGVLKSEQFRTHKGLVPKESKKFAIFNF